MTPLVLSTDPSQLIFQLRAQETTPQAMYVLNPGVTGHYPSGVVLRYMLRYDDGENSGYVGASQGRYTKPTLREAAAHLQNMLHNNSADKLKLYGGAKAIFVGFTACYATHHDPAPIDLSSTPIRPASLTNMIAIRYLAEAINRIRREYEDLTKVT